MDAYMVTFVDEKELGLTPAQIDENNCIRKTVVEKMTGREFILADFNWEGNYKPLNCLSYLKGPYHCSSVVEIRLNLDILAFADRDAIYERCLAAVTLGEVVLKRLEQHLDATSNTYQNIISFDMVA